jgi:hypothetical protein
LRLLVHLSGKTIYHTLLKLDVDPDDADVRAAVSSCWSRSGHRRDIIGTPLCHASPYTAYVHVVMHLMADMCATESLPVDVRQTSAKCLDMFWSIASSITTLSDGVTSAKQFADIFTREWWLSRRISLSNVPCAEALDPRPAGAMCDSFADVICKCEAPSIDALTTLFRIAFPSKRNAEQLVKKLKKVRDVVTERVVNRRDEPDVVKDGKNVVRFKEGVLIMRYVLQWYCVANMGGYPHCKTVVTDWRHRALMTQIWTLIPTMSEDQIYMETDKIFDNRVLTVFIISEYMEHVIRSTVLFDWLNRFCGWRVYSDRFLEFCDEFRRLLPLPPPPPPRVFDPANAQTEEEADWAQMETVLILSKQPTPVLDSTFRQFHLNTFVHESGAAEHSNEPRQIAPNVMRPPAPNVINRKNPFGPRASETMTHKNCYVAMNNFIRRSFVIGSAARIPEDVWLFFWSKAKGDFENFIPPQNKGPDAVSVPTVLNAIRAAEYSEFVFNPTPRATTTKTRRVRGKTIIRFADVRAVAQAFFDLQPEIERQPLTERYGEHTATKFIAKHLHCKYMSASRIIALVMLFFECNEKAVALMMMMVRIYYQHFKSGKPMVQKALARLSREFNYEYHVVFGILSGWREYQFLKCVPLSVDIAALQEKHTKAVMERVMCSESAHHPPSIDWLTFCPNCAELYSLVTPLYRERAKYAPRFVSGKVGVFQKLRVDINTGKLYCSRRTGRRATFCSNAVLLTCCLTGKVVCWDGKRTFTDCCQPGCTNKIECTPLDGFNDNGRACATCMQRARLEVTAALLDCDKKAMKEAKNAETRQIALERKRQLEAEAEKPGWIPLQLVDMYNATADLSQRLQRQFVTSHAPAVKTSDTLRRLAEHNRVLNATRSVFRKK